MNDLRPILKEFLADLDESKLIRENEDLNFKEIGPQVSMMIQYLRLLSENEDWYYSLPANKQQAVLQVSRDAISSLTAIRNFKINPNVEFQQAWRQSINEIQGNYEGFYNAIVEGLMSWVALDTASAKDISSDIKKIKSGLREIQNAGKEIESIKENATVAAGKTSIASFQEAFAEQATRHSLQADKWFKGLLGSSGVVAVIGVLFVILSFNQNFIDTEPRVIVIAFAIKLVVLSALIYLIRICSKNYSAHKHLQTLNEHRVNVLGSLPAFIDSVGGDNKDLMFTIGAKTAFEAGETGLISVKEGAGSGSDELTRILADLMKR